MRTKNKIDYSNITTSGNGSTTIVRKSTICLSSVSEKPTATTENLKSNHNRKCENRWKSPILSIWWPYLNVCLPRTRRPLDISRAGLPTHSAVSVGQCRYTSCIHTHTPLYGWLDTARNVEHCMTAYRLGNKHTYTTPHCRLVSLSLAVSLAR